MAITGTSTPFDDILSSNNADDILLGLAGNDSLSGGGGDDTLNGGTGNDTLDGGTGVDLIDLSEASAGITMTLVTAATDTVLTVAGLGTDTYRNMEGVIGSAFDDVLIGNSLANRLIGGAGNDLLDGGAGIDTLEGGDGDDTYKVDSSSDVTQEVSANGGYDTVYSTATTYTLGANIEKLILQGVANINGIGNAQDNLIIGNAGNNSLNGGAGSDTLVGGGGNDTLTGGVGTLNGGNDGADIYVLKSMFEVITIVNFNATDGGYGEKIAITASGFATPLTSASQISSAQFNSRIEEDTASPYNGLAVLEYNYEEFNPDLGFNVTIVRTVAVFENEQSNFSGPRDLIILQEPIVSAPATFAVEEDLAGALLFTGTPFTDPDSASLTVTLTVDAGTISATSTAAVQVGGSASARVFSGTVANLNAFFTSGAVSYTTAPNDTTTRLLQITVFDGILSSSATSQITITPVNDAPVTGAGGNTLNYSENAAAAAINGALTVSDVDNTTLASATVSITAGFSSGQDVLAFTNNNATTFGNIAGSYNATTGVLTLTSAGATATVAQFQAALRAVTYANSSEAPSTTSRTVSFQVNDGSASNASSNVSTSTITVTSVNDAPTLDATKTPVLATINQDSGAPSGAVGSLVSSLVDLATPSGGLDNVSDPDSGALLGIAITAVDAANGTWHYSTNAGTAWNLLGGVSTSIARLLAGDANTRLYFQPKVGFSGTITSAITFRAWDQTTASNGSTADTTTNGGMTAFSLATDIAAITVATVSSGNLINGTTGNDTTLTGGSGNDTINGLAGNDILTGNDGNDVLDGGAGTDTMNGGQGSDLYLIASSADHGAAEIADTGATGRDELRFASATAGQILTVFAGDTGLESVVIGTGTAAAAITTATTALHVNASAAVNALQISGNAGNNSLTGGSSADSLIGAGGNDTLSGNAGNDSLLGGAGADQLTGGAGIDAMDGGDGSDLYLIASSVDHGAAEIADTGTTGSDELRFASATAGQILTVFAGDTGLESVVIGTGTAAAAITTATTALHVNASAALNALQISGNAGNNSLTGGAGNDTLTGGAGNDTLSGGAGSDRFRFATTLSATTNVDQITDFAATSPASDVIELENSIFTGLLTTGVLASDAFTNSATFGTPGQRIRYESGSGNLFYDSDGNGKAAAILFATLTTKPQINNTHFFVT